MLLLPLLQLPNMHIFNNLYSALSFIPPQPCCLILIPYYPNSSAVLDIFGHVPYLGNWISLACLFQVWWWGKDQCFLEILLSLLIDYTCLQAKLSHHFITYIKDDLILVLFTFPSLSGLDTLFPCHCVFFIFFFSNRNNPTLFLNSRFSFASQSLFLPRVYL